MLADRGVAASVTIEMKQPQVIVLLRGAWNSSLQKPQVVNAGGSAFAG